MDPSLQFVPNKGGVRGVRGVAMDQPLQFVPDNGGSKGSEGSKWITFSNSCRRMGGQKKAKNN